MMQLETFLIRHARVSQKRHVRITLDDKMACFQQLGSLVSSGVPLLQAILITADQCESEQLTVIWEEIGGRVSAGCSLHSAMLAYRNVFEDHWIALVATGEATGQMDQVLMDLNEQIRESRETKRKVSGALTYPMILLFVAVIVISVMLWFVVPVFSGMFEEMGAELPGITKMVVNLSDYVVKYGAFVAVGIGLAGWGFRRYLHTERGLRRVTAIMLATPLVGELTVQTAMYRFASNLSLLLRSGVPMLDTLSALASVFHSNPAYQDAILNAQRRVAAGRPLADSLEESGLFTSMMTNMIRIGEETAELGNMMGEIAPYYKEKMNTFLARVTKLLEPTIIMFMGITIAVVMLAIYIPMFELSGKVQ